MMSLISAARICMSLFPLPDARRCPAMSLLILASCARKLPSQTVPWMSTTTPPRSSASTAVVTTTSLAPARRFASSVSSVFSAAPSGAADVMRTRVRPISASTRSS